jgi:GNAT superfamily N-acetyltransferase
VSRVVVRRAGVEDWQTVRRLRLASLADAPYAFLTSLQEAQAYPDHLWQDRIATTPHFVATVEDAPVGKAVVIPGSAGAELVGVWVAPQARGHGVVESLIDASVAWAREQGDKALRLWVVEGNERAERAYARYGFSRTGAVQPVPGRPDDTEVEMAMSLRRRDHLGR